MGKQIEARQHRGVYGIRKKIAVGVRIAQAALRQAAHQFLGKERIAAGAVGDPGAHRIGKARSQSPYQLQAALGGERLQRQRSEALPPASPVRPAIEQLGAAEGDDQQWCLDREEAICSTRSRRLSLAQWRFSKR